jgi:UDP-2,4-diacetamido-2,4,6-trideoxy-beta-L-altropyranose hydrolase
MGTGHVMRCLALAQAWQDAGGHAVFVIAPGAPGIEERLKTEGAEVVAVDDEPGGDRDVDEALRVARRYDAAWIVVDGYHLSGGYHRRLKRDTHRVLRIDDNREVDVDGADILVNPNAFATPAMYEDVTSTGRMLLGTQFTPLRREFTVRRGETRHIADAATRVLVTLGGGDVDNVTLTVMQGLGRLEVPGLEVTVLVGGSNPHLDALTRAADEMRCAVRLEQNVIDMPARLAWADLALSAGGSTCWEMAFMGLPVVTLVIAENQRTVADSIEAAGAGRNLGWFEEIGVQAIADVVDRLLHAPDDRRRMSQAGRVLVDGGGAGRIVEAMCPQQER